MNGSNGHPYNPGRWWRKAVIRAGGPVHDLKGLPGEKNLDEAELRLLQAAARCEAERCRAILKARRMMEIRGV